MDSDQPRQIASFMDDLEINLDTIILDDVVG